MAVLLLITHYTRILRYIQPQFVHVFVGGRIVESGRSPSSPMSLTPTDMSASPRRSEPDMTASAQTLDLTKIRVGFSDLKRVMRGGQQLA
jgi:hypothetical protein